MFSAIIVICAALVLIPDNAFAWGPATHLEAGLLALDGVKLISPRIAEVITAYPYDFLYGNIGADIVVAKNMVPKLKHCHRWIFGFNLLKKAESDSQRAFAHGYICHLAADTVAHNHFIPEMMIRAYSSPVSRHIYWEMRFDGLADKAVWEIPKKMVKEVHRDNDKLLSSLLERTPLSFVTNKTIFSSIMSLQRVNHWHRMLALLSSASKWSITDADRARYFALVLERTADVLKRGHEARCVNEDPTGMDNLAFAKKAKSRLRAARFGGGFDELMKESLQAVAPE